MQVFLTGLVDEDLVDGLSQEALIEAADAVFLVSLVDNLNEIALLQQSDGLIHAFSIARCLRQR